MFEKLRQEAALNAVKEEKRGGLWKIVPMVAIGLAAGNDLINQGKVVMGYLKVFANETFANPTASPLETARATMQAIGPWQTTAYFLVGTGLISVGLFFLIRWLKTIKKREEKEEADFEVWKAELLEKTDKACGLK